MKDVLNVAWLILGGFVSVLFWGLLGCIFCATIVGIPLGKQLFKVMKFALKPRNDSVEVGTNFANHFVANLVWLPFGLVFVTIYVLAGVLISVTIVGIPVGRIYFEMVALTMAPFGIEVDEKVEMVKEWEEWKNW